MVPRTTTKIEFKTAARHIKSMALGRQLTCGLLCRLPIDGIHVHFILLARLWK